jgi:hypothetical protein
MSIPAYSAARSAAAQIAPRFAQAITESVNGHAEAAVLPGPLETEAMIDAGFWASLRREEGRIPKISLAYLAPDATGGGLRFARRMALSAEDLVRLSPAVERPGIHLGVWPGEDGLEVWGATRSVPPFCFILEVVAPGLLVVKHRREDTAAKFVNVAVLEADQVKILDPDATSALDCPDLVSALIGVDNRNSGGFANALVELSVSMRAHARGGTLLMVPADNEAWLESIVQPITYAVTPPFTRLADLMGEGTENRKEPRWRDSFRRVVDSLAGLTSVDGATIIDRNFHLLGFGAKIGRRRGWPQVEQLLLTEPFVGAERRVVAPSTTGGTRHLSAAQFAHDQRSAVALVASQDGRFSIFEWSSCERMVHAHRIESLLL